MAEEIRKGCQTPTQSVVLPYYKSYGEDAVALYEETGRKAQEDIENEQIPDTIQI